jgi:hypothetical protein
MLGFAECPARRADGVGDGQLNKKHVSPGGRKIPDKIEFSPPTITQMQAIGYRIFCSDCFVMLSV